MTTDNLMGKKIGGDFLVEERIGQGGMAAVYRARQLSVNRDVALKIININEDANRDSHFKERFANEADIIAKLEHIHILPVYAYGIDGTHAYLAMRLLRGGSVKELLNADKPLPLEQAVLLFEQIAKGLAYAHSKGIIHRDLKPANILLDENHNAYLMDFGLAKIIDSDQNLTRTDNVVGTLAYMSPEHLRGEKLDHRADIYSMGCVLYHMLTGRVPFRTEDDEDLVSIIYKHLEEDPTSPSEFNPDLPDDLEHVLMKALAKDPKSRYQSMADFSIAVRNASGVTLSTTSAAFPEVAASLQSRSSSGTTRKQRKLTTRERQRRLRMAIGVSAILIVLLIAANILQFVVPRTLSDADQTATTAAIIAANATVTPEPLPTFEVLKGTTVRADQLVPTEEDLARAKQRLGETGFVAIMACNMTSEYHATLNREMVDLARSYGLNFEIYDSDSDGYQQRLELEKALVEGAQGVILCPLDYTLLDETLLRIQEAHLPLVSTENTDKTYGGVVSGTLNFEMGFAAGSYAGTVVQAELDGKAEVIILDYPDLPTIIERADGLEAGLKRNAPDVTIVGRYRGATQDFGYESVKKLLDEGGEFNVILSINDAGSYGAIKAMEEAGIKPDEVLIFSIDAEQLAVRYIQEGNFIRASLQVGRTAAAEALVNSTVLMLAGKKVGEQIIIPPGDMVDKTTLEQ